MMRAFTRSVVAGLATLVIFPFVSVSASAQGVREPHFGAVTAAEVGEVTVRNLPTVQTNSHRGGVGPFRHTGNPLRADHGTSVELAVPRDSATAATSSAARAQVVR